MDPNRIDVCRHCGKKIQFRRVLGMAEINSRGMYWIHVDHLVTTPPPDPTAEGFNIWSFNRSPWMQCEPDNQQVFTDAEPLNICWADTNRGHCESKVNEDFKREGIMRCGIHGRKEAQQQEAIRERRRLEEERKEREELAEWERQSRFRPIKEMLEKIGFVVSEDGYLGDGDGHVGERNVYRGRKHVKMYELTVSCDALRKVLESKGLL